MEASTRAPAVMLSPRQATRVVSFASADDAHINHVARTSPGNSFVAGILKTMAGVLGLEIIGRVVASQFTQIETSTMLFIWE